MGASKAPTRERTVAEELAEIENYVKDSILTDGGDGALNLLVSLVAEAKRSNRPVYPSVIEEPYFFRRYIRPWIEEGIEERIKSDKLIKQSGTA